MNTARAFTALTTLAITASAANAEPMQLRFTAGLNQPVTPVVINGVPGEAVISVAAVVAWDSDEVPFIDNGSGLRRWGTSSFQAHASGSIILEDGAIIPIDFVFANTANNSITNSITTNYIASESATDMTFNSSGGTFAGCALSNAAVSLRTTALTSMPGAGSPLPDTPQGYQQGVTYWQCVLYFDIDSPGGGTDTVHISANVFDIVAPGPIKMTLQNNPALPPIADLPAATADINTDGIVDTADLGILLGQFGSTPDCN
ncbi:MAG: hypothetical protein H6813_03665 [Phycisphaeraceae bacterium]|nr:hypothetical protein [Phycisphaeraceae bacterium]MCB9847045.1 hypothetical protein [Phycisphaeraceae bacterium]